MTFSVDVETEILESADNFEVSMSNFRLDWDAEPVVNFDGVSDFSDLATNVVNTLGAVVRNRLESLVNGNDEYPVDK